MTPQPPTLLHKPRPLFGISRIDQPEKKNHGYYVRLAHHEKYFPDLSSGGKGKALQRAKEFRDTILATLPAARQLKASKPKRKAPKSGVTNVFHTIQRIPAGKNGNTTPKIYTYWQALWLTAGGERRTAKFSIHRHGNDEALRRAIAKKEKAEREVRAEIRRREREGTR